MKIDVFSHVLPPRYLEERNARGSFGGSQYARYYRANPALTDLDVRFEVMDRYPEVVQVLTIAGPNVESVAGPRDSVELARIANDELAELVDRHPERTAWEAPRNLKEPLFWKFSHLKNNWAPTF